MKLSLKHIQAPVAKEMSEFERKFRHSMRSRVMLLDKITGYIVRRKGKQVRPLFVFLSAAANGDISDATYRGASLIELLHTATLVHDDVVDNSNERRGFFSINALWRNKIAVLVGDFLLSRGLELSLVNEDYELLKITTAAVKQMSEGELLQMENARKLEISEDTYYKVIRQKTASLITACCKVGAASVDASIETIQKMGNFGEYVGMAFQIKDDLFDFGTPKIGKPIGADIRERKITLPLIFALNQASKQEVKEVKKLLKKSHKDPKAVRKVVDFVKAAGGTEHAIQVMKDYQHKAKKTLDFIPDTIYKQSLELLVQFTIERTH